MKLPRDRRPASRAARPCPERRGHPAVKPPHCCPARGDDAHRRLVAHRPAAPAGGSALERDRAVRVETQKVAALIDADLRAAQRGVGDLECGLDCLEADIAAARGRSRR